MPWSLSAVLKLTKKNDLEKMGMFPLRLRYGPVVVR